MCSTPNKLACCSGDNVFDPNPNENETYPQVVNKHLPSKVLEPIVQNKIIEVPKEVYLEKIVEVPQIKTVERIVEQIRPVVKYKNIYKTKTVYVEKIKNIDKIIYEEKIIEVPQIKTIEKVVEVPVYVDRERIIHVPKYMVVEKVIPVLKTTKKESIKEIPEIIFPNMGVIEDVESEEHHVEELKENETASISNDNDAEILNNLHLENINSQIMMNIGSTEDTTVDTIRENNYCTTVSCKFIPPFGDFPKIQESMCKGFPEREKRFSNINIYATKDNSLPKIRISKTPNVVHRGFYCN
ncbi:inner membrane complex protein 1g, putative [Plasmodium berghei]|uniref:Inner membrane complex protein 1g, putative n=2 Tax=Plasmodium berghei TaxID=5821 RepID=A0A509APA5_PLABA|nr:inner membrane complex protein 1g, putative [Plasmodium berghei ANKA]CXI83055.1 inner membrane complex protein 1g, putative [Plasmodium berghei]SCM25677.1 inner membrane complex protein 1g, putative [Plasmodium berghei]SCN27448.1 inner membrane complex protein 1g, putative [Plasmodium berghei]SCO62149.1 inner membrane complex protein 1g, putative [Plasmodium berghei]SCO63875.1 inner membrane complex protein 1g, putative [Plasmodium berghei]|eukprot:XP_034423080.1 inner membrane complex protein 1g, putative [Plasmodium berghei ANKA]